VHLTTGVYNVNSLSMAGNSTLLIDSGPVILNIGGQGVTNPIDLTGGTLTTLNLDPRLFQIQYAGTANIKLEGGSNSAGLIYAPNAAVSFAGGSNWYGGVVAKTVDDQGGTKIHNDRRTDATFYTAGNYMLSAFSWKKY
jgi:hypothetical protein